nr:WW domain-binding protein 1-like [Hydra vulgaris]
MDCNLKWLNFSFNYNQEIMIWIVLNYLFNVANAKRTCSHLVEISTTNGKQSVTATYYCITVAYCCQSGCCYLHNLWYFWFIFILIIVVSCSGCCYYAYRKKKSLKIWQAPMQIDFSMKKQREIRNNLSHHT